MQAMVVRCTSNDRLLYGKEDPAILRRTLVSICAVATLALAQPVCAQFSASLALTGDAADPANVFPLTPMTVTVTDTQGYGTTIFDNAISRIQLNWTNSSAGLGLTAGSTWTWGAALAGLVDYVDADMSDGIVGRINAGECVVPGTYFSWLDHQR